MGPTKPAKLWIVKRMDCETSEWYCSLNSQLLLKSIIKLIIQEDCIQKSRIWKVEVKNCSPGH